MRALPSSSIGAAARLSPAAAQRRPRSARGYTAVEILMSMSVLAVGVIGVFSMEKVTVASNVHAKNLAIATHIAQSWLGVLEAESTIWRDANGSLNNTTWLKAGPPSPTWFRPDYVNGSSFGPDFDELGNPVPKDGSYCVDLRISRFNGASAEAEGSAMRRVEVRVYWLREGVVVTPSLTVPAFPCGMAPALVSLQEQSRLFHFVYLSGAVRQAGT
jgi:hypothetical protein